MEFGRLRNWGHGGKGVWGNGILEELGIGGWRIEDRGIGGICNE